MPGLGIPGLQDLKPAVESKSVQAVGCDAPAGAVDRLQDQRRQAALLQPQGARKPEQASADNDDVCIHGNFLPAGAITQVAAVAQACASPRLARQWR